MHHHLQPFKDVLLTRNNFFFRKDINENMQHEGQSTSYLILKCTFNVIVKKKPHTNIINEACQIWLVWAHLLLSGRPFKGSGGLIGNMNLTLETKSMIPFDADFFLGISESCCWQDGTEKLLYYSFAHFSLIKKSYFL